jgi:hypothetical protein
VRPELDVDGAAAPPRANGELAFDEAWQSRLFATTMAACDAGLIDYDTFRDRLIAQVAARDADGHDGYWAAWQDAFEGLTVDVGLVAETEIADRARAFDEHS